MATIVTRSGKGSPLTHAEVDANFQNLNTDKAEVSSLAAVANGSAKAWVNFNGTGTIAARDSFNVASLTDNGTGDYTINFTNAMANANYKTDVTGDVADTTASGTQRASLYSSTQYKVRYFSLGVAADTVQSNSSSCGDLA